jgi:protein-S-isoprenylcysteine O-methyltransferase Ste14
MSETYAAWAARWRVTLGFALGIAFLVWSRPRASLVILGGLIALAGLVVRGAAAGYLEKGRALATDGPYRYTRSPLYLGSFILGAGLAVAGGSWPLALAFLVLYTAVYAPVMRREEAELRIQFGEAFERYVAAVPLFIPGLPKRRNRAAAADRFRWERYRKNREYEAALGYVLVMLFLAIKMVLG